MSYYLDEEKLKAKIAELNAESARLAKLIAKPKSALPDLLRKPTEDLYDIWEAVAGLYWYPEVTRFSPTGDVKQQASGILLKLFANKKTGEFKSFPAQMFE